MFRQKIVTTLGYSMNIRTGEKSHHIAVGHTDAWKYYRGKLYHWYDMRFPVRVPGWRSVERLCRALGGEIRIPGFESEPARWRDKVLGWTVNQDLRCHHLNSGQINRIETVRIDQATYDFLCGHQKNTTQ